MPINPFDPFGLPDPFGDPFGLSPSPQQQLQQLPSAAPTSVPKLPADQEEGLFSKIGSGALHGLGWIGGVLDKTFGGRAIRGGLSMLGGRDTPASELLSFLPGSDVLGITNPENSVSGAELLGGNKDTPLFSAEGLGGLATEVLLDPSTYMTLGGSALSSLGQKAAQAGIKLPTGAARAAGLAGSEADKLARFISLGERAGPVAPKSLAEVTGKSLGGHVGVGLPGLGNLATFDLSGPMAAAGSVLSAIPGSSLASAAAGKIGEAVEPLKRGFSSLFDASVKGQINPVLQEEARAVSKATPEAIYGQLGKAAPFNEEIMKLAGWKQGMPWSPELNAEANKLDQQFRIAVERTPASIDDATRALAAAGDAGALAKVKEFEDITARNAPVLAGIKPEILDLARRGRQEAIDQLALEHGAGFLTENLRKPGELGPEFWPRAGSQFPGGPRSAIKQSQLPAEEIAKRDKLLRNLYTEGPGSVNWLTGTPEGKAIQQMELPAAQQEILKQMFGWSNKELDEFVALSNKKLQSLGPADEAALSELLAKHVSSGKPGPWLDTYRKELGAGKSAEEAMAAADKISPQEWVSTGTKFAGAQGEPGVYTSPAGKQYKIDIQPQLVKDVNGADVNALRVTAHDETGKEVGRVLFDRRGNVRGASGVNLSDYTAGGLSVDPLHQKQGIANAMYDFAQSQLQGLGAGHEVYGRILPSAEQTGALLAGGERGGGKALWEKNAERASQKYLSNIEQGQLSTLLKGKAGSATKEELGRLAELQAIRDQAQGLAEWQRKLDLDALAQTGGFFGNNAFSDWERYLENRAVQRLNAGAAYSAIPKLATTESTNAVPVLKIMENLGLNAEKLPQQYHGMFVPEAEASALTNWIRPSTAPQGAKPWLDWIDSITNLTKAGQTSWPATQARNILSDMFNRFAYGGSPVTPLMEAKTFREGGIIPGIAKKVGMEGLSDAEATQGLAREMYQLGLMDTKKFQAMEAAGVNPLLQTQSRGLPLIGVPPPGLGETLAGHVPGLGKDATWGTALNPLETRGVGGRAESKFLPVAAAQSTQNYAEEMNRIATYLDARSRGFNPLAALGEVTKAHLDFSNLAPFEKNVMRRIVPFYCVPDTAEILTRDGWKNCDQLVIGEEVMTYNQEKDCLEWQCCQGKSIFDHNQSLMHFETPRGKAFDFTPEHRWPVRKSRIITGDHVHPEELKTVAGSELRGTHSFIQYAQFLGTDSILTVDQARLLGWLMTDGSFRFRGNHCEAVIYQSKRKFLKEVKQVAGGKPRKPANSYPSIQATQSNNDTVCVPVLKERVQEIRQFLDKDNLIKVVTRLSRPAAEAMYDAMYKADGTVAKGRKGDHFGKQHNGIKAAFRVLALMIGKSTTESDKGCYISANRFLKTQSGKITWRHFKGRVWCPRTPNGTWIMKQGSTIVITGNSWSRQNIPNMISELATNPGGRMAQTMRLLNAGTDQGFLPETVTPTGYAIPVGTDQAGRNNYLTSLGLPFEDLANLTSWRNLMGSTSPFVRLPFELATGRQTFTGQTAPATYPFEGNPLLNTIAMNSPLSRIFTTYRAAQRGLEGGNYLPVATQLLAGPRITSVDPLQARRAAVRELAFERLTGLPQIVRSEDLGVRPGQWPSLSPEDLQLLQLYNAVNRRPAAPAR